MSNGSVRRRGGKEEGELARRVCGRGGVLKAVNRKWKNMATAIKREFGLRELEEELVELANAQHDSRAYRKLFSVALSVERIRAHHLQKSIWTMNRRDCWAYAQAQAPFGVKQLIWEHEREELRGGGERNVDNHQALGVQEGAAFGLTQEDYDSAEPTDVTLACVKAWVLLAKEPPWTKAFGACAALELSNSEEVLRTKSASKKMAERIRDQLGVEIERQHSLKEHMIADVEHAHILSRVARDFTTTELERRQILDGAKESWAIDRAFREHLADLMASIPA